MHAYGCDAVLEEKCILIQGKSVDEWDGVDFPKAEGWRHRRLDVRAFRAKIEVLSPTSASTSLVANVDPKAPLPKAMVNFVVSDCSPHCALPIAIRLNPHVERMADSTRSHNPCRQSRISAKRVL